MNTLKIHSQRWALNLIQLVVQYWVVVAQGIGEMGRNVRIIRAWSSIVAQSKCSRHDHSQCL